MQYKCEVYCWVSLSSRRLRSQEGTSMQMGGILPYKLQVYTSTFFETGLGLANFRRIAHSANSSAYFPHKFRALFLQGFRHPPKMKFTPKIVGIPLQRQIFETRMFQLSAYGGDRNLVQYRVFRAGFRQDSLLNHPHFLLQKSLSHWWPGARTGWDSHHHRPSWSVFLHKSHVETLPVSSNQMTR